MEKQEYFKEAVDLLMALIATPSTSRNETAAADLLESRIKAYGLMPHREGNNVWIVTEDFSADKPTLLLNAHIDTVKPVDSWQRQPFTPTIEGDLLYGLGSNDCGGGLVTLLQVFRMLYAGTRNYNMGYVASAEEEVSGKNGISRVLPLLPKIDVAIVGEPTAMQPAIAERGLMVLDVTAHGKSGHAARGEGINAIYEALDDIRWIHDYRFEKVSPYLGPTQMTLTVIHAGTQHNVVPDRCTFTVDIRSNECYTNEQLFELIKTHITSTPVARSFRLCSSSCPTDHVLVRRAVEMGRKPFGSPTLSDQALMRFPSLKMGPGKSERSHTADEFILISEIEEAIHLYLQLLTPTLNL